MTAFTDLAVDVRISDAEPVARFLKAAAVYVRSRHRDVTPSPFNDFVSAFEQLELELSHVPLREFVIEDGAVTDKAIAEPEVAPEPPKDLVQAIRRSVKKSHRKKKKKGVHRDQTPARALGIHVGATGGEGTDRGGADAPGGAGPVGGDPGQEEEADATEGEL